MAKKSSNTIAMVGSALVGFLGTGYLGNVIEDKLAPNVKKNSAMNDKLKAIVANDTLKLLGVLTLRKMKKSVMTKGLMIGTGLNLVVDMYLRYQNNWAPGNKDLLGYPVLSETSQQNPQWIPLSDLQLQEISRKINSMGTTSYIRQDYS